MDKARGYGASYLIIEETMRSIRLSLYSARKQALQKIFGLNDGIDEFDFLHEHGTATQALLYSILFVPKFVELDGSILLECNVSTEESKKRFLDSIEGEFGRENIEASFNFVEIGYLFNAQKMDTTDEQDFILAQNIAQAWEAMLQFLYPTRKFIVEIINPEQSGSTVAIQFFEMRSK